MKTEPDHSITIFYQNMAILKHNQALRLANQFSETVRYSSINAYTIHQPGLTAQQQCIKRFYAAQTSSDKFPRITRTQTQIERWRGGYIHTKAKEKARTPQQQHIRAFSRSVAKGRDHHFDTLKFVQRLKDEGFTEEQSVAVMKVLSDVIEER